MEYSDAMREKQFVSGVQFTFDLTKKNAKLLMGIAIRKEYLLDEEIDEIALDLFLYRDGMACKGDISSVNGNILQEFNTILDDENLDQLLLGLTEKVISYCI